MSVEAQLIAAIVSEGRAGLRKAYNEGLSAEDFIEYEEEMQWVERRVSEQQPVNPRIFRRQFDDFDWLPPTESIRDLAPELKQERALTEVRALIESVGEELRLDNAMQMAERIREMSGEITRLHSPHADHLLISGWREHIANQKRIRRLREGGTSPGIPTGIKHIDFHWDGLVAGRMIVVLGRPGEGKSYLNAQFMWSGIKNLAKVLFFSPEMNRHEHTCRLHTLASADKDVQKAVGLERSFRNRALMNGMGYNIKTYSRFCEYLADTYPDPVLVTKTHRKQIITPQFLEARIEEVQPDLVLLDPIYKIKPPKPENTFADLMYVADAIEDLADTYNIPIVVTNQAHRQMTGKGDAPHKDTSFGSDVPIQEADHVIGVKNISDERRMILRCTKSRFGQDFRVEMVFHPNTGVLYEIEEPKGSYFNGDDDPSEAELKQIIDQAVKGEQ